MIHSKMYHLSCENISHDNSMNRGLKTCSHNVFFHGRNPLWNPWQKSETCPWISATDLQLVCNGYRRFGIKFAANSASRLPNVFSMHGFCISMGHVTYFFAPKWIPDLFVEKSALKNLQEYLLQMVHRLWLEFEWMYGWNTHGCHVEIHINGT